MATKPKGLTKTGGRKKGVPNKNTKALKDMILGALVDAGGQDYLSSQAKKNPVAFMGLLGKVLPSTLTETNDKPPEHKTITIINAEDLVINHDE